MDKGGEEMYNKYGLSVLQIRVSGDMNCLWGVAL